MKSDDENTMHDISIYILSLGHTTTNAFTYFLEIFNAMIVT